MLLHEVVSVCPIKFEVDVHADGQSAWIGHDMQNPPLVIRLGVMDLQGPETPAVSGLSSALGIKHGPVDRDTVVFVSFDDSGHSRVDVLPVGMCVA
jgi:hypothetical protein